MGEDIGFRSGVLGVVGTLCRQIGLVDVINEATEWHPQAKMGPGERILALIMCIFGDRRALWRVQEYFEDEDLEVLFGPGVRSDDFNDDALGRALDKLYAAGAQGVMATLAMRALAVEPSLWREHSGRTRRRSRSGVIIASRRTARSRSRLGTPRRTTGCTPNSFNWAG